MGNSKVAKKLGCMELAETCEESVTYRVPEYVEEMYMDNRIENIAHDIAEAIVLGAEKKLTPEEKGKFWEVLVKPLGRSDWALPYKNARAGDSKKVLTNYIKNILGIRSCVKTNCGLRGDEILALRLCDRSRNEIEIQIRGDTGIQRELWNTSCTTVAYPKFITIHL